MIPHDAGLPDPSSPLPPSLSAREQPHCRPYRGPAASSVHDGPAAVGPGPVGRADLYSMLLALQRRWISAVLLSLTLGTIAGLTAWWALTPKSTAFARLKVDSTPGTVLGLNPAGGNDFKTYMQTTAASITSRPVIMNALKREEVRRLGLDRSETDPVQVIEDGVSVETKENSELLTVMFMHSDPVVAVTVTQAIKNVYMEDFVDAERRKRAAQVTKLEKIFNEKVEGLSRQKENLKTLAARLGTTDPRDWRETRMEVGTALRDAKQQQSQVGFKLVEARAQLAVFEGRLKAMGKIPGAGKAKDPKTVFEEALEDAFEADAEAKLLRDRIARQQEIIELYVDRGFDPDYLSIVSSRDKIASLQKLLDKRKQNLVVKVKRFLARNAPTAATAAGDDPAIIHEQLQKQVESLKTLDDNLQKDIKTLSVLYAKAPVQASEHEQLADAIKGEEEIVKDIGSKLERERVELTAFSRINSWQDADLMKKDVKKQLMTTAAAPLAMVFAVCTGLAWMEYRHRRVRTAAEISRGLGIRVVGAVPRMANLERHLVNAEGESDLDGTPVMESIDAIRMRLLYEAAARSTRVVMVTSATEGEGKTTLASHLASSLARAGRKTLLLDGDLRHPTLHELFEVPVQPGFSEVLLGEVEVAEAARETHQENLSILPAGQWDRDVLQCCRGTAWRAFSSGWPTNSTSSSSIRIRCWRRRTRC